MYWIYGLPNWALAILIVTTSVILAVVGLFVNRPIIGRLVHRSAVHNDIVSYIFSAVGVLYGLTLGLIAVATWQNFTAADSMVTQEASILDSLYRDLHSYPQQLRSDLEELLRVYTRQLIDIEWPAYRQGRVLITGTRTLEEFKNKIAAFEPSNNSGRDKINHFATSESLDKLLTQRRTRLQAVPSGLPAVLWVVVLLGGMLVFLLSHFFWVDNVILHAVLVGLQATILGLLIFLTAAMDNAFRGDFSISPDAFEQVFDQTMKPYTESKSMEMQIKSGDIIHIKGTASDVTIEAVTNTPYINITKPKDNTTVNISKPQQNSPISLNSSFQDFLY